MATSTPEPVSAQNGCFVLCGSVDGHRGPVATLTAYTGKNLLASGGMDGTRVWDLSSFRELARPSGAGHRGATTVAIWLYRDDDQDEVLTYGTEAGYLVFWKRPPGGNFVETRSLMLSNAAEVSGLAFDSSSCRLAVCNRNALVQLHQVTPKLTIQTIFSIIIKDFLPKSIAFGQLSGDARKILVFGRDDGRLLTLRSTDGQVENSMVIGGVIGSGSVNANKFHFCIDIPNEGVALYQLGNETRIHTFKVPVRNQRRPRQVCFGESATTNFIVSGSDHGSVYVFDRQTKERYDRLDMPHPWYQHIAVTELNGALTILAASMRESNEDNAIFVWSKRPDTQPVPGAFQEESKGNRRKNVLPVVWQNIWPIIKPVYHRMPPVELWK